MKKRCITVPVLLIMCVFTCCDDNDTATDGELATTWLLYEQGYSPGAGYITDAVPSDPAQTITFHSDSTFTSSISGYKGYQGYRIRKDVLSLFKIDKSLPALNTLNYSYKMEGNDLRLYFRFCTEGCHMAFRRVEE